MTCDPNAAQAAGEHRVRFAAVFDDETLRHDERFHAALGIRPGDRVLDVGCGTGGSTRTAARATGPEGHVLGLDLSGSSLEHARRITAGEGLRNVTYLEADAQTHAFEPAAFDVCISSFGTMFFADPLAAFTNIARAMRAGARLVLLVWQRRHRNAWPGAVHRAVTVHPAPPEADERQSAFSLGDRATTTSILTAAGFDDIAFDDVHEPVRYGPDAATAYEFVLGLRDTRALLAGLDDAATAAALARLRTLVEEHATADGVLFDARTWVVSARRAP